MNFVSKVLESGGDISPLIINNLYYKGTGLFNPSIYLDHEKDKLLLNIRHCQYTIFHAENNIFEHQYGPLVYLNPENDISLTTKNYLCELNDNLEIISEKIIDTSLLDVKPLWEFVGLEDVRIFRWDGIFYACGVRRDTTNNGQGRMELSAINFENNGEVKEYSRYRIPTPLPDVSYCEKNWMPITDMPYHFVKWCNPTEVVKVDVEKRITETVYLDKSKYVKTPYDYRGGSQVIPFGDYRIACVHTVNLFKSEAGRKNATYRHCFVVWDKNWNVVRYTEPFDFMGAEIEFCAGMTEFKGYFLLTFGYQDNTAYVLKIPRSFMEQICLN